MQRQPAAAFLIIGNEILSGRTQDANLAYLGGKVQAHGISLREARVIPDIPDSIVAAVNELRHRHDYVFTSGGIGPTHDDITARWIAEAFGRPFVRNAEAERRLLDYYDADKVNPARMSMADMPEGVELIDNPVSIAPGFRLENVYVLAGVPKIFQAMVDGLVPGLAGGTPIVSQALTLFCPEGDLAERLGTLESAHPGMDVGSYPFFRQGRFGTTVVARSQDGDAVEAAMAILRRHAETAGIETASYDAQGRDFQTEENR